MGLLDSLLKFNDEFWGGFEDATDEVERELTAPEGAAVKPLSPGQGSAAATKPKPKHLRKAAVAIARDEAIRDAEMSGYMTGEMYASSTAAGEDKGGKKD